MSVCPSCGNELREGARFCGKCGAAIKQDVEVKASPVKCPVCGMEVRPGARFCSSCGADLSRPVRESSPAEDSQLVHVSSGYMQWNILPGQIAVRIDESDMAAIKDLKGFTIQPGIKAFVIADGKIAGELAPQAYKLDDFTSSKIGMWQRFKNFTMKLFTGKSKLIEDAKFVSVVLLRSVDFPLVCTYENIRSRDVAVNASLHFLCRINNIMKLYETSLVDRKVVTFDSFSSFLHADVAPLVKKCLDKPYDSLSDDSQLTAELFPSLKEALEAVYPFLTLLRIVSFSISNEEMEKVQKLQDELFVSEHELEHLAKRNDFISRLNAENYRQELANASSQADFLALMEKVDEKKLLTEDEREQFASHLASQRMLRNVSTKDEEETALAGIRKAKILRESEVAELERMVAHKAELKGLSDAQIIEKTVLENKIELGAAELRYEREVVDKRLENEIERQRKMDSYQEEKRRRESQLDKEDSLSQLEILRQAQAIRMERDNAEHQRKMEEMRLSNDAELERNKLYAGMSVEQIMAINPNISPDAAAALAEKFKSQGSEDKLRMALDQKDEMRSFMEAQMSLMRDMVYDHNAARKEMLKAKDEELDRVRSDSAAHESRYSHVMETTVQAVAAGMKSNQQKRSSKEMDVVFCPSCGAQNPAGSMFCAECGGSLA